MRASRSGSVWRSGQGNLVVARESLEFVYVWCFMVFRFYFVSYVIQMKFTVKRLRTQNIIFIWFLNFKPFRVSGARKG